MSGMWKRSHGRTSEAPPDERGGYRYVRPTATAPHLDSTHLRLRGTFRRGRLTVPLRTLQRVLGPAAHAPKPTPMITLAKCEAGWKPDDRLPGAWRRPCADSGYRATANVKTAHLPERLA